MRIIRQVAPNTRAALRAIRERLGENAIILSSCRTVDGVEVTAGAEIDDAAAPPEAVASAEPVRPFETLFQREPAAAPAEPTPAPAAVAPTAAYSNDAVGQELKTLRSMLETQLAQLAWNDLTRRSPIHAELLRELTEIGLGRDLAERIAEQLPRESDLAQARRFAFTALAQYVGVTGERWAENGGRLAFIGTTGVGKTTSLAKLAARWTLKHGARELALIAGDGSRIGAADELRALGQLLGAQVFVPESFSELPALLARLTHFRLVLIDTPGTSSKDSKFANQLAVLASCASILDSVLVLSANTQAAALEEIVRRFAPTHPACALLTKVDEAATLGGSLSALIRAQLPLCYISEGPRVPEDLKPARALDLVSRAVALAKESGASADEDLLRRRFGKVAHAGT
jgi:flagellar biosynthesis protein FlhF